MKLQLILALSLFAQDPPPVTFKSDVVAKSTKAVNYRHRMGATLIDFKGTAMMPRALGKAKVESKAGRIQIDFEIRNVQGPTKFGSEYLTYILWAITPEGRPRNLGEIQLSGGRGKLSVTTELQAFGLIVTAEPYFAVTMPSDLIVAENELRLDTLGRFETIDAKYELLQRGEYAKMANPIGMTMDPKVPLELYQARNALLIARSVKAEKYAPDIMLKAQASLKLAEAYQLRNREAKPTAMMARDAVQRAEDARAVAVKRAEEERLEAERAAAAAREATANKATESEARMRAVAEERQRQTEVQRKADETRLNAELERAKAESETLRAQALRDAGERRRIEAELASAKLQQERQALEASQLLVAKVEGEKAALRERLLAQFNQVLETHDSPRGLVVIMDDLLFDLGKATLRADTREKLARLSGLALAQPSLKLETEGHTDTSGSDSMNQRLSEQRAEAVRAFIETQGIAAANLTAQGFGKAVPLADNTTAKGRQQNRRVEIIVSGEVIGTKLTASPAPALR